jgi:hypothetical protein
MFIRRLKNRSTTWSVQIIVKSSGKYKVFKTIGSASSESEVQNLLLLAKQELDRIARQPALFGSCLKPVEQNY